MSSKTRNAEKKREYEAQLEKEEIERARLMGLSLSEQLDEAESLYDVKRVLQKVIDRIEG